MKNYQKLMSKIIKDGIDKSSTVSLFGETLTFNLAEGFPILTTRKMNYSAAFAELACFIRGYTDVRQFREMGVKFWDADCAKESWSNSGYKIYDFDLGRVYGYQWKRGFGFDQIGSLVENIKNNPDSRRHILITYNPADLDKMCLNPCYVSHQFYAGENNSLNMLVHQRSADFCLGVPNDIISFAMFLTLMAKSTGRVPGILKIIFGDVHIYKEHFSGVSTQINRSCKVQPKLILDDAADIYNFLPKHATFDTYQSHPKIAYPFITQEY